MTIHCNRCHQLKPDVTYNAVLDWFLCQECWEETKPEWATAAQQAEASQGE